MYLRTTTIKKTQNKTHTKTEAAVHSHLSYMQPRCLATLSLYHQCHHLLSRTSQQMNANIRYHLSADGLIRDSQGFEGGKQTQKKGGKGRTLESGRSQNKTVSTSITGMSWEWGLSTLIWYVKGAHHLLRDELTHYYIAAIRLQRS